MMYSFRQQLTVFLFAFLLLICIVGSFRINEAERVIDDNHLINEQAMNPARFQVLEQILNRRALYDPAFGDSWSNYLEKKRSLFDPAYNEWANTFKRSDE